MKTGVLLPVRELGDDITVMAGALRAVAKLGMTASELLQLPLHEQGLLA
ncbi:MAG: hypothetical protein ACI9DC_002819 [Gammaproteobacteria bacterium]|jgi:hypothetical protein